MRKADFAVCARLVLTLTVMTYTHVNLAIVFIVLFVIAVVGFGIFVYWRYTKRLETAPGNCES